MLNPISGLLKMQPLAPFGELTWGFLFDRHALPLFPLLPLLPLLLRAFSLVGLVWPMIESS